jgi:S-methylmethionine-dependent homocysteine/selenocysteine methylase
LANPELKSDVQIAASVGCYGGFLADGSEFTGDYKGASDDEVREFHLKKLKVRCVYFEL